MTLLQISKQEHRGSNPTYNYKYDNCALLTRKALDLSINGDDDCSSVSLSIPERSPFPRSVVIPQYSQDEVT